MMLRTPAGSLLALGLAAVLAIPTAGPAAGPVAAGDNVSRSEYRAIAVGMTRAQVVRVTHHADSATEDAGGHCRLTRFKGWSDAHHEVVVLFDSGEVAFKTTTSRHEAIDFTCDPGR